MRHSNNVSIAARDATSSAAALGLRYAIAGLLLEQLAGACDSPLTPWSRVGLQGGSAAVSAAAAAGPAASLLCHCRLSRQRHHRCGRPCVRLRHEASRESARLLKHADAGDMCSLPRLSVYRTIFTYWQACRRHEFKNRSPALLLLLLLMVQARGRRACRSWRAMAALA